MSDLVIVCKKGESLEEASLAHTHIFLQQAANPEVSAGGKGVGAETRQIDLVKASLRLGSSVRRGF